MKKKKTFPLKPALLLGAAAVLLLGSTVGSTRAALTYYSENYTAQMNLSSIGVTLKENGAAVSSRDYAGDGNWTGNQHGELLTEMLSEGEKLAPGKKYDEAISVENSGNIDTFVRVIIRKSWQKDGRKDQTLSPELIDLQLAEGSGWVQDTQEASPETMVLYYTKVLAAGEETPALSESIRIDSLIAREVKKQVDGNRITYVYAYDGYTFHLEAEVDAVQTHSAQEAVKSAWGVNVTSDGNSIRLQ